MEIKIQDIVSQLISNDSELQRLRIENRILVKEIEMYRTVDLEKSVKDTAHTSIETNLLAIGRRELYRELFEYNIFYSVSCKRNEDEEIEYQDFKQWSYREIESVSRKIPPTMSREDIFVLYQDELKSKYTEACEKSYKRLLEKEKEESEDEE